MQYREFGKTGFKASALGFGCMRLPCKSGGDFSADVDFDEVARMIRCAADNGVNYFDTGYPYHGGNSEVALGKALEDGYRQKVVIADKSPVFFIKQESDFDTFLETQLKRLNTDYIDFYLLHSLTADLWNDVVRRFDVLEKVERAKKEGKIGHIGFSFHDNFEAFKMILDDYDAFKFGQIQLNYLDIDRQAGLAGLNLLKEKVIGAVIMEPLMGGRLASLPEAVKAVFEQNSRKKTPVEWGLDFLWDMDAVSLVLSGMNTMQQVVDNITYANSAAVGSLTEAERASFAEAKKQFGSLISVPCTGCGYCLPCPSGVNIPRNFSAYNDLSAYSDPTFGRSTFARILRFDGREAAADSCIGCRACEEKCPQHIEISQYMPDVAEAFKDML